MDDLIIQRKYSVSEIASMRKSVRILTQPDGSWREVELIAKVEHHLRTYMMAGIAPEELEERARAHDHRRIVEHLALGEKIRKMRDAEIGAQHITPAQ
jgi:hypothetical protein